MMLLTKELKRKIPALYSQEGEESDPMVVCKFFHPMSSWTWYVIEAGATIATEEGRYVPLKETVEKGLEIQDVLFFGLVDGLEEELGYFTLNELKSVKIMGLGIERDRWFKPTRLSEIRA